MLKTRVLFLGTPDFALPALRVIHKHTDLVGVVTQPDRPYGRKMRLKPSSVAEEAHRLGVPVFKSLALKDIQTLKADCALVVAYGQLLPQAFLDLFPLKVINLHASLLPRWRGAAPIQRALMAGDTVTGVCLQEVVKKLDAGPLLGQSKVNISEDMRADQLMTCLSDMGANLVEDVFLKYLGGEVKAFVEQDSSLMTYAPKIKKLEGLLDFRDSAQDIFNRYRGLFVWPGVWTKRSGKILKIKEMALRESLQGSSPGLVINISPKAITVACGKGAIDVLRVQPESKTVMTAREYINGYSVCIGEKWLT